MATLWCFAIEGFGRQCLQEYVDIDISHQCFVRTGITAILCKRNQKIASVCKPILLSCYSRWRKLWFFNVLADKPMALREPTKTCFCLAKRSKNLVKKKNSIHVPLVYHLRSFSKNFDFLWQKIDFFFYFNLSKNNFKGHNHFYKQLCWTVHLHSFKMICSLIGLHG